VYVHMTCVVWVYVCEQCMCICVRVYCGYVLEYVHVSMHVCICMCSTQFRNLRNLEIAHSILRSRTQS